MGTTEDHLDKYLRFKAEGDKSEYVPSKIENYFLAAFHLIDAVFALHKTHAGVHKKLQKFLKESGDIFGDKASSVANSFRRIERDLRPGVIYGSQENGQKLKEALFELRNIEELCFEILKGRGAHECSFKRTYPNRVKEKRMDKNYRFNNSISDSK
jgi:hypothetical protein